MASVAGPGEDSAPAPWVLAGTSSLSPPVVEGQGLHGSHSRDLHIWPHGLTSLRGQDLNIAILGVHKHSDQSRRIQDPGWVHPTACWMRNHTQLICCWADHSHILQSGVQPSHVLHVHQPSRWHDFSQNKFCPWCNTLPEMNNLPQGNRSRMAAIPKSSNNEGLDRSLSTFGKVKKQLLITGTFKIQILSNNFGIIWIELHWIQLNYMHHYQTFHLLGFLKFYLSIVDLQCCYFIPDSKVNQLCIYRHSLFSRFFSHKVITQHWAERLGLHGRSSSTWLVNTKWNVLTDCLGNGLRHRNVQVNAPPSVGAVPCWCYPSAWQELPRPLAPRAPCIQHVGTSWLNNHTADWLCSLFLWVCVHVCSVVLNSLQSHGL